MVSTALASPVLPALNQFVRLLAADERSRRMCRAGGIDYQQPVVDIGG
jgi:hypothetical protein